MRARTAVQVEDDDEREGNQHGGHQHCRQAEAEGGEVEREQP
jgi:hypothetical protein